ncbi:hypothetical protein [Pseudomonas sp. RIT-PI-AD]|uniref:hypothetical protein n=1 Tax=Pseudomonas sp. RIT-PI-AD TaxID=3035294 RepID=UPI0021D9FC0B|nr:hypothetical protein [Pseudomonas sp. RIT-PI-AD]
MLKTLNRLALILGILLTAPAFAAESPRPPIGNQVIAYSGQQGLKVWTLRVDERSANQALVQIGGIDHDWNMRIQKMAVEKTAKDVRYSTDVDGQPFVVLILRGNHGELHLPGESQELPLGYDDALSQAGNPEHFLTDYLQQSAAE